MPPKSAYVRVLNEHRSRLTRLIEKRGVDQLRDLYDDAASDVKRRLDAIVRGKRGDAYTATMHRQVLAQLRDGQATMAGRMADELSDITEDVQIESIEGLASDLRKIGKIYRGAEFVVPIDEAVTLRDLVGKRREQLDDMHAKSFASWGARTFDKVHTELSTSLAAGETVGDATDRLLDPKTGDLDLEPWQAERIARTELTYAANITASDGIQESAKYVPEMMMRWVEHCDDSTGFPLDIRVGVDSIAMHGQVAKPGGRFFMPESAPVPDAKGNTEVPESLVGQSWTVGPLRPNGRETLFPWFPGMGVLAWRYVAGEREYLE